MEMGQVKRPTHFVLLLLGRVRARVHMLMVSPESSLGLVRVLIALT